MDKHSHETEDCHAGRQPTGVDELECEEKRHRTYADSLGKPLDKLTARQGGLVHVRRAYRAARATARPEVAQLRTALYEVMDRIRGMLEPYQVERLDGASQRLHKELAKHCPLAGHRSVEGFGLQDDDVPHKSTDDLRAERVVIDRRVTAAEQEYDEVSQEPNLLRDRLSRLCSEIKQLDEDSCADGRIVEPRFLYARGLSAGQHLDEVWAGFEDVDDFGDWLWRRLSLSARGHRVLALVEAQLAFRECEVQHRSQRCAWQREHFAEAVLLYGHEHELHAHHYSQHHEPREHAHRQHEPCGHDKEA